jgi:tRNA dimethylallyltransferase
MVLKKPLLVCVVGPTAIGKTKIAIEIAKAFATEIISADSRQFYKEMNVGTAVPSSSELDAVTHHFIQSKSIFEPFSVGDFEKEAIHLLEQLFTKHHVMVMVGGSGLYVDAVVNGLDTFPEVGSKIREALNTELATKGIEFLQKELEQVDPMYFQKVDIENPHRLIRALEVYRTSGKPFSSFLNKNRDKRNFDTIYIGLSGDRKIIYDRINKRVDKMMGDGLLSEVKKLYEHRELNALQTVGYRELFQYLENTLTIDEALDEIKKNTRRFAKRQATWLRKNEEINWFDYTISPIEIIEFIKLKNAR